MITEIKHNMKIRHFLTICAGSFLLSCYTKVETRYEYGGVTIERLDQDGISTFYYMGKSERSPRIWAEYSGFVDGFEGYLIFQDNKKVTILVGDGLFKTANTDTSKFECKYYSGSESTSGKGVYEIILSTRYEKERNSNNASGVKAFYSN